MTCTDDYRMHLYEQELLCRRLTALGLRGSSRGRTVPPRRLEMHVVKPWYRVTRPGGYVLYEGPSEGRATEIHAGAPGTLLVGSVWGTE